MKIQKKKNSKQKKIFFFFFWGGGSAVGVGGGGGGVGWGVRVDVIEELKFLGKFPKKLGVGEGGWVGGGGRVCVGDQGGCERNIEVFVKFSKK